MQRSLPVGPPARPHEAARALLLSQASYSGLDDHIVVLFVAEKVSLLADLEGRPDAAASLFPAESRESLENFMTKLLRGDARAARAQ